MRRYLTSSTSIAPLAVFRVLFGLVMAVSIVRFALNGWIHDLYVEPTFFFPYYGFDWVAPLPAPGMYAVFVVMGLAAVAIMLGWHYRAAALLFFLAFTYVELIDKTNYLNHYYFVSVVSFLLLWVPAHRRFSLDVVRRPELRVDRVPRWTVDVLKLQLGLVYLFAGVAKLHPEWLVEAMPLRLWLPAHAHLPLVGPLLAEPAAAYLFSWAGALYDLTVVFFLLHARTRPAAYAAVVAFHLTTAALFQIGMFPYIMILLTLVFFSPAFHEKLLARLERFWGMIMHRRRAVPLRRAVHDRAASPGLVHSVSFSYGRTASTAICAVLVLHFTLQILLPMRAALYPGDLFWTEEGYRFSWRVMLMEKAGYATFRVRDAEAERSWEVRNYDFLTPSQEKMMSTQPDMILQFAHHLEKVYRAEGVTDPEVTVDAYVTLNGRPSRLMIDPAVDLTTRELGLAPKDWILPLEEAGERWLGRR